MAVTVNGHVIGDRVGTEFMTRVIDNDIYSAFYSKIEINGKMVLIRDENNKTGQLHAMTRKEAKRLAIEARDRIRTKAEGLPQAIETTE